MASVQVRLDSALPGAGNPPRVHLTVQKILDEQIGAKLA